MRSIGSHGTCVKSQHWGILGRGLQVQGQPELRRGSVKREKSVIPRRHNTHSITYGTPLSPLDIN